MADEQQTVAQVHELVEQTLVPGAMAVDQGSRFPSVNIAALAELGLFGMVVREADGGLGLSAAATRQILRSISSGCGATAFAFAQHHGATAAVATTKNAELRARWLPLLVSNTLAGTAFAHVRRPGTPVLRAVEDQDGWSLTGTAPWVTSWGHAEMMSVAASTDDGRLVWAFIPASEAPGLVVDKHFDLMVFQATNTVALRFDGRRVAASDVLSVIDAGPWAQRDRALAARPSPLCLGIGDRALRELRSVSPDLATSLESWWIGQAEAAEAQCRRVDEAIGAGAIDEALVAETAAARATALLSVQQLTTTLLAASGGSGIESDRTAQRLSREALFYVIQAQSPDGKQATIAALAPAD